MTNKLQIRDIAKLAGVSPITVSRYMNNPDRVSAKTREKIAEVVKTTGYIPNALARNFSSSKSNVIGVVIPSVSHSSYGTYLQGLVDVFEQHDYQLLICSSGYSHQREEKLIETLISQQAAAIILTGQQHSNRARQLLHNFDRPVVETWEIDQTPIDLGVGFSNYRAAYDATSLLIQRGYRDLSFISPSTNDNDRIMQRKKGFFDAMQNAGLKINEDWIIETPSSSHMISYRNGANAMEAIFRSNHLPRAVFLASDILALGALSECQRRGVSVPQELALCGFDDHELSAIQNPSLTTVQVPYYEMGKLAAEQVITRLTDGQIESNCIDIGYKIIPRQSIELNGAALN